MSTSLLNCEIQLSKDLGDYFTSAATSDGAAGGTTIVDTELQRFGSGWITKAAYDMITSGTYDEEERKIAGFNTSTLTTLAHGGQIVSGVTYRVHRIISASNKRISLIEACNDAFPNIHDRIRNEDSIAGNWLRNGSMFKWTATTIPDHWVKSAVTAAQNTTKPYYFYGTNSCKLDTAAGYIYQGVTENPDLWRLAGKTVTFSLKGWCDTASALRLAIYDGTDTEYSSYHDGDSAWNWKDGSTTLQVTHSFPQEPTNIEFRIYLDDNAATAYVEDARAIGPFYDKVYVGDLELAQNYPINVFEQRDGFEMIEPWPRVRGHIFIDEDGFMHLGSATKNFRLRVEGVGYLDFIKAGVSSTAWDATINIDDPQTKILAAQAVVYIYNQFILPNMTTGGAEQYFHALSIMKNKLADRIARHNMLQQAAYADFGDR